MGLISLVLASPGSPFLQKPQSIQQVLAVQLPPDGDGICDRIHWTPSALPPTRRLTLTPASPCLSTIVGEAGQVPYSCCFSPEASQEISSSFSRSYLAFFRASFACFYTLRIFPGWASVEGKEGRLWRHLLTKAGT